MRRFKLIPVEGTFIVVSEEYFAKHGEYAITATGVVRKVDDAAVPVLWEDSKRIVGHAGVRSLKDSDLPILPVVEHTRSSLSRSMADEWVFTDNPDWSNNDDTGPDNFGSFTAGYLFGRQSRGLVYQVQEKIGELKRQLQLPSTSNSKAKFALLSGQINVLQEVLNSFKVITKKNTMCAVILETDAQGHPVVNGGKLEVHKYLYD